MTNGKWFLNLRTVTLLVAGGRSAPSIEIAPGVTVVRNSLAVKS